MKRMNHIVVAVLALTLAGCTVDSPTEPSNNNGNNQNNRATRTNFLIYAVYAQPNVTVYVNGSAVSVLRTQYQQQACNTMLDHSVRTDYKDAIVGVSAFVGQTFNIRGVYPDGSWWEWKDVVVTQKMVEDYVCYVFEIPAPRR